MSSIRTALNSISDHGRRNSRRRHPRVAVRLAFAATLGASLAGCNPEGAAKAGSGMVRDSAALRNMAESLEAKGGALLLDAGRSHGHVAEPKLNTEIKGPSLGWHVKQEIPISSACGAPGVAVGWMKDPETGLLTYGACRGSWELARRHPIQ